MTPTLRLIFKTLDTVAPSYSAQRIYNFMSNPRSGKLRDFEIEVLDKAQKETIQFNDFEIKKYIWGEGEKVALCVHGWEGQGANFGGLVATLLKRGYQVVAYDGPSHGFSSKGKTNWFDYIALTGQMAQEYKPEIIISHSFGSVASAAMLRNNPDINVKQWYLITSPHDVKERIKDFTVPLGVTERTVSKLVPMLEADTGEHIDDLNMSVFCADLNHVKEAFIIHGLADKVLPIHNSRRLEKDFPQAQLIELEDLGHFRILWSDSLIEVLEERLPND